MKKVFMAALAVCAMFATTSCSNDDENLDVVKDGKKAMLNIEISEPTMTRATGAPASDVVSNYTVFVTNQSDQIGWKKYSDSGSNMTGASAMEVSNSAKHVYIVANAGDLRSTITSMTELNNFLADLNGAATINGLQTTARWATGSTASALTFADVSGEQVANASITLTFIAARITVSIVNGMTGYDALNSNDDLVLKNVAVLNARGESKLFTTPWLIPATPTTGKKFYEGIVNNNFPLYPATGTFTVATSLLNNSITADDFTTTYHYYVFENDATTAAEHPTIVTLVGTFDGKTIYYPVHLADYETFTAGSNASGEDFIKRGRSYNITINMKVDPTNPGGVIDPFVPLADGKVNISLSLTDWIPVTLGKEFQ